MDRKSPRMFEPLLVARALESLEERVTVPGSPVTDAGSFLERRWPRVPWKLCAREEQVFLEVIGGGDDDAGPARAPLDANLAIRSRQVGAVARRPVRKPVLEHGCPCKHRSRLAPQHLAASFVEERQQRLNVSD